MLKLAAAHFQDLNLALFSSQLLELLLALAELVHLLIQLILEYFHLLDFRLAWTPVLYAILIHHHLTGTSGLLYGHGALGLYLYPC